MVPLEEVRVVAVADVAAARARVVGEAVGARVFIGTHALIRRVDVEAVLIAIPPYVARAPRALCRAARCACAQREAIGGLGGGRGPSDRD
jgi:hypothetical protein